MSGNRTGRVGECNYLNVIPRLCIEWHTVLSNDEVQLITVIVSVIATVAAGAGAFFAYRTARETSIQSRIGLLPRLMPNEHGFWLPKAGQPAVGAVENGYGPLVLKNIGRGPAVNVQWQIAPRGAERKEALVPRQHTLALVVEPRGLVPVECTTSLDQHGKDVPDEYELTIWFDDALGHHYRTVFVRNGDRWQETF